MSNFHFRFKDSSNCLPEWYEHELLKEIQTLQSEVQELSQMIISVLLGEEDNVRCNDN